MAYDAASQVISREISNVNYNLGDSRVYNVSSVVKSRNESSNNSDVEQTISFSGQYTTSKTMTWSDSAPTPSSISASMHASIPYVVAGLTVELSEERNFTLVFGNEKSESRNEAYETSVTIPPRKRVIVTITATRAQCDVPFSYRVVDTLSDGTVVEHNKNDGLFSGANEFGLTTNVIEEDL